MSDRPVALVTGGAKRIGAAVTADLANHGFSVAVHARMINDAAAHTADIRAAGGIAEPFSANLADPASVAGLMATVRERLGPVALLVNNASIFEEDSVTDFDWDTWERHFALHLKAPALLSRLMAKDLAVDAGLIVNIIDQRVDRLNPRFLSYTLSKSALWTATQTMAQALAPRIRVNAIGPGPTLRNARQSEADFAAQISGLPLRRRPALAEFGATIRWMWQTPSLTGQIVHLDGGQHLAWETPDIAGIPE